MDSVEELEEGGAVAPATFVTCESRRRLKQVVEGEGGEFGLANVNALFFSPFTSLCFVPHSRVTTAEIGSFLSVG